MANVRIEDVQLEPVAPRGAKAPVADPITVIPADAPAWRRRYPDAKAFRVVIDESPEIPPTGLFVQINGDSYMIRAGEEVTVPDFLLDHLDNCIVGQPVVDPMTARVVGYRERKRITYQMLDGRK